MRRAALASSVALLLAGAPARGGWSESQAVKAWGGPGLNGVAVASQAREWWAVGDSVAVVKSADGFATAPLPVATGLSGVQALEAIWLSPDAATVHMFGRSRTRASFVNGAWTTSLAIWGSAQTDIYAVWFLGPDLGYLTGDAQPGGYLARFRWPSGDPDATVTDLTDVEMRLVPRGTGLFFSALEEGLVATGSSRELLRYSAGAYTNPHGGLWTDPINAVHFAGGRGVMVGGSLVELLDPSGNALGPATVPPAIGSLQDVFVTASGFTVAVGAGGEIAESQDFGATWALKAALPGGALGRVTCLPDGNQCVAVGRYASTGTAAAMSYANQPPSGTVLINGLPDGTPVPDDAPICLSVVASDPEGDPIQVQWVDPNHFETEGGLVAVQGSTGAAPPCFEVPESCGGATFTGISVALSDGRLAAAPIPVHLTVTHALRPPTRPALASRSGQLQWSPGQRYTVDATGSQGDCGTAIASYAFSALPPLPAPRTSGASATFDLTGICLLAPTPAAIEAVARDAQGGTSPSSEPLVVSVLPDASAPSLALPTSLTLAWGTSQTVDLGAHHACARAFEATATCDDGSTPSAAGSALTFSNRDPALCAARSALCAVRVAALDYPPAAAASGTVALVLEPPARALAPALEGGPRVLHAGETVELDAGVDAACGEIAWTARRRSNGALVGSGAGLRFELTVPSGICGADAIDVEVAEPLSGLRASLSLAVEQTPSAPAIAAPAPEDFDPADGLPIDCEADAFVRLRPRVLTTCAAEGYPRFRWRSVDGLPVQLEASGIGPELGVTAPANRFDLLAGRTAAFELTAEAGPGLASTRVFSVRFLPRPFVSLAHQADRAIASPGELVWFQVATSSACPGAVGGIDLRVALEGLEFVSGSASRDGVGLPDPELGDDGRLAIRGVPLADASGPGSWVRYAARRGALAGGWGSASAQAYLTRAPDLAVSDAANAGTAGPPAALGAVTCGCGAPGASPLGAAALVLLALTRRARRSW